LDVPAILVIFILKSRMKNIVVLTIACFSNVNFAQQNNIWCFPNNNGLNFNSTTPTVMSSQNSTTDNSSSISDNSGNLLFYTDVGCFRDKNHNVMPNGSGILNSYTSGQASLIVPIPCSNKYAVFSTTDFANPGYLSYSVIDMSLNSGLGDVVSTQKNISLGAGWTEQLCAYYNSTSSFYWVVSHKWNSNQFVAFKVDAVSIAVTTTSSNIGSIANCGVVSAAHDAMGQLTISPDGLKLINPLTCQDKFELFDFNVVTGALSNLITINGNGGNAWGAAFSPDSKKLYVNSIFGSQIFQYDLTSNIQSTIQNSKYSVYNTLSGGYNFGYLELGPDGKIYTPRPNSNWMSVVNSPNSSGSACSFTYSAISFTNQLKWGLSRIAYNIPSTQPTLSLSANSSSVLCYGNSNGSATIQPSSAGTYTYAWSPGNYTTQTVSGLAAGLYTVQVSGACGSSSVVINLAQPSAVTVQIIQPAMVCLGQVSVLNSSVTGGTPAYSYTWSSGPNTPSTAIAPSSNTSYTLSVTDANSCVQNGVITVSVTDCTGINEIEKDVAPVVYPNCSAAFFYVKTDLDLKEVTCTDQLGKILNVTKTADLKTIDLSQLNDGIYYLTIIRNDGKRLMAKVMKRS
jgi:hypothetical protein